MAQLGGGQPLGSGRNEARAPKAEARLLPDNSPAGWMGPPPGRDGLRPRGAQAACGLGKGRRHTVHHTSQPWEACRSGWLKGAVRTPPARELAVVGLLAPSSRPSVRLAWLLWGEGTGHAEGPDGLPGKWVNLSDENGTPCK